MKEELYAHSHKEKPSEQWHQLEDHLKSVAEMALDFINEFQAPFDFLILTDSNERR